MSAVNNFDSSQGDTIEYNKSGKKKKKVVSKPKKSEYQEFKPSTTTTGKVDPKKSGGSLKKSSQEKKNTGQTPTKVKKEKPRVGPSAETSLTIQKRKQKFNTMPTELPSSLASLKISRTNSEENLKQVKRSVSHSAQEPMLGLLGDFTISPSPSLSFKQPQLQQQPPRAITPPPLSPNRQNPPMRIEVEWNKKSQFLEVGLLNYHKLKEIIANAFTIDLDFVSKMCLNLVIENYFNGKFEQITESNVQSMYHAGNAKLRLVIVDESEEDDE